MVSHDGKQAKRTAQTVLKLAGQTYAQQAGIRLANTPAPLYQLLVLSLLLSTRISADIAVAAARELRNAHLNTPQKMLDAHWQDRVDALGRGHYRRYDESTATRLGKGAQLVLECYHGDLRKLADAADHNPRRAAQLLQEVPGIGPTGADIFLREAQAVWPWLRPYVDRKVTSGAQWLRLPADPNRLSALVGTDDLSTLAAGLIRVELDRKLAVSVREDAGL